MRKVWSILAATLLGVTVATAAGCKSSVRYDRYAHADLYDLGGATFAAGQVQAVEIDWLGGNVEIEQNVEGKVIIAEDESVTKEEERMRYYVVGSTLKVQYCASGIRVQDTEKNLHVSLPAGLALDIDCVAARINALDTLEVKSLSVESVSGSIEAERILCTGEVDVETVSGSVEILELTADEFSVETTSGNVSVQRLSVRELDGDTASGEFSFGMQKELTGEIDTVSGSVKCKLLDGLGATVNFETVSGEMKTQSTPTKSGKCYTFPSADGRGSCNLRIETFSGNLSVE